MTDQRVKFVPPSVYETAFNCPHCGALAAQEWTKIKLAGIGSSKTPPIPNLAVVESTSAREFAEGEAGTVLKRKFVRLAKGEIFTAKDESYSNVGLANGWVSSCFNCGNPAVWLFDRLLYPAQTGGPPPNPDLPDDVRFDYLEAATVLGVSPRSAAALLRLALQKLCVHLGEPGKNIDKDIGALVAKGLDVRVQQAMDAVRVIGNNAVHPGQMDLRDDRATAEALFGLINLICDRMISQPKHVDALYAGLPASALEAIQKRDAN